MERHSARRSLFAGESTSLALCLGLKLAVDPPPLGAGHELPRRRHRHRPEPAELRYSVQQSDHQRNVLTKQPGLNDGPCRRTAGPTLSIARTRGGLLGWREQRRPLQHRLQPDYYSDPRRPGGASADLTPPAVTGHVEDWPGMPGRMAIYVGTSVTVGGDDRTTVSFASTTARRPSSEPSRAHTACDLARSLPRSLGHQGLCRSPGVSCSCHARA